jgi:hypothetical protein
MKTLIHLAQTLLLLGTSISHAGLGNWLADGNLEVHRLAVGEARVIKGTKVVCLSTLTLSPDDMENGAMYMAYQPDPIRDQIPGVSLYCGRRSDAKAHREYQRQSRISDFVCRVDLDRTTKAITLTVVGPHGPISQAQLPEGSLGKANSVCAQIQEQGQCACRPLAADLVRDLL